MEQLAKKRPFWVKKRPFWLKRGQNWGFTVTDWSTELKCKLLISSNLQGIN
jgi:hypothetical protein